MRSILTILIYLSGSFLLAGCYSHAPRAVTYETTPQHKLQAVEHWRVLASETAERLRQAVNDREDLQSFPLMVEPPDATKFSVAFAELLKSELVSRGMQVAKQPEDGLVVEYDVMRVKHHDRDLNPPPGSWTALPLGIRVLHEIETSRDLLNILVLTGLAADAVDGYLATESENELLVTVSLARDNRYVLHTSSIYYIHDPDLLHYIDPAAEAGINRPDLSLAEDVFAAHVRGLRARQAGGSSPVPTGGLTDRPLVPRRVPGPSVVPGPTPL